MTATVLAHGACVGPILGAKVVNPGCCLTNSIIVVASSEHDSALQNVDLKEVFLPCGLSTDRTFLRFTRIELKLMGKMRARIDLTNESVQPLICVRSRESDQMESAKGTSRGRSEGKEKLRRAFSNGLIMLKIPFLVRMCIQYS